MENPADIGIIGLAVMGANLARNFASHGFRTAVYNRTPARTDAFLAQYGSEGTFRGSRTLSEFVASLARPRKIMLMIQAGAPVDACLGELVPLLEPGDIVMDGGNSFYKDSLRRGHELAAKRLHYLGVGISGGEEGALHGPSLMPGGDDAAWPVVKPLLTAIAARADGEPCCGWIGPEGAGHYVKMVHNGIEYADMQLIAEAYGYLRDRVGLGSAAIGEVFTKWSHGVLAGYLLDITGGIFKVRDSETGAPLVELILDAPGQKGTGRWTSETALELNVPTPTLTTAVLQRNLDADKAGRLRAAQLLAGPDEIDPLSPEDTGDIVDALESALYASKICAYAQGFELLKAAERQFGWRLDCGSIALLWRGGCIIRARFLGDIRKAYERNPQLENLMFDDFFRNALELEQDGWRLTVADGALSGTALPAMASALSYYDSRRRAAAPSNLIQAQRDCFGAHTFERIDRPRGQIFHQNWNL